MASYHQAIDPLRVVAGVKFDVAGACKKYMQDGLCFESSEWSPDAMMDSPPEPEVVAGQRSVEVDDIGSVEFSLVPVGGPPQQ